MKLAGVIGWPVAHSLSPRLHTHWLHDCGVDGAYIPLAVRREDFSRAIDALAHAGFRGSSVTLPHKEAAFALAHSLDRDAASAGAVNQLVFRDNKIHGMNTDIAGLVESLRAAKVDVSGRPAILIGAGGAARAALVALRQMGAGEIWVLNRTPERARALGGDKSGGLEDWKQAAKDAALVVNASTAGMKNHAPLPLDLDVLPSLSVVCDLVYNPLETALLAKARARGLGTVDGLGMLIYQAVPAFEAFFGARPKVTPAVRKELEDALAHD